MPAPGNVAIGLTFALYKVSLCALVSFLSAWITLGIPPLVKPAGANHGAAAPSVNAYTPGITVDAGTNTFLPVADCVCSQGQ